MPSLPPIGDPPSQDSAMRLDRRSFVGAATAVGLLTSAKLSQAGEFTDKIRKAVKYHMITVELSVPDKLRLLRDVGFDGVEIRTADAIRNREELVRASQAMDFPVHGIVNSSNPDIESAIQIAREVGATSVLVVVPAPKQQSYLQNYRERQQIIRKAVPLAEKLGIKLLVENVWASFLIEPLTMQRFVDEFESPAVGVYFDVGNNIRWGNAEHWIEVLGQRIGKLDIKEYSRELQNDEGLRAGFKVEIGEGSVDWKRVRDELRKIEYQGWATAEVRGGDRQRLAEIAERMNRVLDL